MASVGFLIMEAEITWENSANGKCEAMVVCSGNINIRLYKSTKEKS